MLPGLYFECDGRLRQVDESLYVKCVGKPKALRMRMFRFPEGDDDEADAHFESYWQFEPK